MSDALFTLDPLLPYWLVAIFFVAVVTLLVWFEIQKSSRFRILRIVCVFLLMLSLSAISLRPKIRAAKSDIAILFTGDLELNVVDSLKKEFPSAKLLSFDSKRTVPSSTVIQSPNEIPTDEVKIVAGNGLGTAARDVFDNHSFKFVASPMPTGIVGLSLPQATTTHTPSRIEGTYNNDNDSAKILLEGPGGKEDSVIITNKGITNFDLSFTPRQQGNFNYSISLNGKKEVIPIAVESEKKLRILFIQMFPTFETGYLKNILANDHQLVFRYQLSKNNFRYEYINHSAIRTDRLSGEVLQEFDLVVVDTDALKLLSSSEKESLEANIESGLGVLILLNENPKSDRNLQSILPVTFKPIQKDTAHFILTKTISLPVWPVQVVNDGEIIPIVKNSDRILTGYIYKGFGKIGFQLLQETYRLTLEGDSSSYKNLWSSVIHKNARPASVNYQVKIENDFPIYANEPVTVQVISSSPTPPLLRHNGIKIPMAEDVVIDDLWKAKVWPDKSGWQELQIEGDSAKHLFYVSENDSWKSLAIANSIQSTEALTSTAPITAMQSWEYKPFAPWLFYLVFLLSAGTLWLVPKIK